jgi:hypothetical protein
LEVGRAGTHSQDGKTGREKVGREDVSGEEEESEAEKREETKLNFAEAFTETARRERSSGVPDRAHTIQDSQVGNKGVSRPQRRLQRQSCGRTNREERERVQVPGKSGAGRGAAGNTEKEGGGEQGEERSKGRQSACVMGGTVSVLI